MTLTMKFVFSSHIDEIGYDDKTEELHVQWSNGKYSVYFGVPQQVARDVLGSPSIGESLHQLIKKVYKHQYVEK